MDTKNVIAAISLSAAVIILYSLFWAPNPQELKRVQEEENKVLETTEAPTLEVDEKVLEISRSEAKSKNKRPLPLSLSSICFSKLFSLIYPSDLVPAVKPKCTQFNKF